MRPIAPRQQPGLAEDYEERRGFSGVLQVVVGQDASGNLITRGIVLVNGKVERWQESTSLVASPFAEAVQASRSTVNLTRRLNAVAKVIFFH